MTQTQKRTERADTPKRTYLCIRILKEARERLHLESLDGDGVLGSKAVEVLDGWADGPASAPEGMERLPAPYSRRRCQLTVWVKHSTALKIYEVALGLGLSQARLAGVLVELWAANREKEREKQVLEGLSVKVKVTDREKLREYQRKWREKNKGRVASK